MSTRIRIHKSGRCAFTPAPAFDGFYQAWRAEHSVRARLWPLAEAWPAFLRFAAENPNWKGYPMGRGDVVVADDNVASLLLTVLIEEQSGLADPRAWVDEDSDGHERRNAAELRDEAVEVLREWRERRAA